MPRRRSHEQNQQRQAITDIREVSTRRRPHQGAHADAAISMRPAGQEGSLVGTPGGEEGSPLPVACGTECARKGSDPSRLRRRIEVSVCRDTEQNPPLVRPPGREGEPRQTRCLYRHKMSHKDRHREEGVASVRANERNSYTAVPSRDGLEGEVDLVRGSTDGARRPTPNGHASARAASLAHARALLIYLKHRGVLNVEEFRRTNPWPVDVSGPVAQENRRVSRPPGNGRTRSIRVGGG
jgi:hypothetical protein